MAIIEILKDEEPIRQQKDLVEKLRERGIAATQSSVSRDLAELGAFRAGDKWMLSGLEEDILFEKVAMHVTEVKPAGPHMTLLVTQPGAGAVVAQAVDDSRWDEVVGTVAGTNSVLLLTYDAFFQKLLLIRLHGILRDDMEDVGEPIAWRTSRRFKKD
jgi:transcriptional regulator of arginine metabolism